MSSWAVLHGPTARRPAADRARRVRFCTQPGQGLCCCCAAAAVLWSAPISASARFTLAVGSFTPADVSTGYSGPVLPGKASLIPPAGMQPTAGLEADGMAGSEVVDFAGAESNEAAERLSGRVRNQAQTVPQTASSCRKGRAGRHP